ncbi:MAG TPA: cytochrome b [Steroidobacteraceae bacterium]
MRRQGTGYRRQLRSERAQIASPRGEATYTRTAIILHWLLAAALLCQILLGWYVDEVPSGTPERSWIVNTHKSIGLVLGLLIVFRFYWRLRHPPPPLPGSASSWTRLAANASHRALYACMIIMPLSGYIASNFSKWGVKFFNAVQLPPWGIEHPQIYAFFHGTHVVTSYVFVALILLHVFGALRHAVMRDGIFRRMLTADGRRATGGD